MKVAKCIKIDDTANIYTVKYETGEIEELTGEQISYLREKYEFHIFNLVQCIKGGVHVNKYAFKIDMSTLEKYKALSLNGVSKESEKADIKASILGTSTYIEGSDIIQSKKVENTLVITDKAYKLDKNIIAKTVLFVGNRVLESDKFYTGRTIKCNKAIIKNPTIMSLLVPGDYIKVIAHNIVLQHDFIDINTVHEVLFYLDSILDNPNIIDYADTTVQVDFEKAGVDTEQVLELCKALIYQKVYHDYSYKTLLYKPFENTMSYISLMCSMYISTGYKYYKLLEYAEISEEDIHRRIHSLEYDERKQFKALKTLIDKLYNGFKF